MTPRLTISLFLIGLVTGLPGLSGAAFASAQTVQAEPAAFIRSLADEAISVLRNPDGTIGERRRRFRAVLRDDFAMRKIGRFAAGKYWRRMSKAQKREYQTLFEEWILKTYSVRFGGYGGETVRVLKTIRAGRTDVYVRTRIQGSGPNPVKVDWRVRKMRDGLKIIDVVIEGISMLVTQKAEFGAVLRQRGVDGLLRILRSQLDRLADNSS